MENRNTYAVNILISLGYPLTCIRKALHKLTGISQPELAERMGVSRSTVTATINGSRGSSGVKSAIADIFNVPVDVLFNTDNDAIRNECNQTDQQIQPTGSANS